ncbi:hypothetical protein ACFQ07_33845, partial [Actinomadura adrarensis]
MVAPGLPHRPVHPLHRRTALIDGGDGLNAVPNRKPARAFRGVREARADSSQRRSQRFFFLTFLMADGFSA